MKFLKIFFFSSVFLIGCRSDLQSDKSEIEKLKKNNDSLTLILRDIGNKYVFDSISFREIPSLKNTQKINSEYNLELVVVGYSPNRNYFIKYDSIHNNEKINPDTLIQSNGGFKYSTELINNENPIWIEMDMSNEYGKSAKGVLYDVIKVK